MSRRGIHPLLMGLDRPERVVAHKHPVHTSGLESAQRKRYLKSEEQELCKAFGPEWREVISERSKAS